MGSQLKKHSFAESIINVLVGYGVSVGSQIIIFPLFGYHMKLSENLQIGLYFTVISIARSYVLRRVFNKLT